MSSSDILLSGAGRAGLHLGRAGAAQHESRSRSSWAGAGAGAAGKEQEQEQLARRDSNKVCRHHLLSDRAEARTQGEASNTSLTISLPVQMIFVQKRC